MVRFPAWTVDVSPLRSAVTGSGAHSTSCLLGIGGSFVGGKVAGSLSWSSTHRYIVPRKKINGPVSPLNPTPSCLTFFSHHKLYPRVKKANNLMLSWLFYSYIFFIFLNIFPLFFPPVFCFLHCLLVPYKNVFFYVLHNYVLSVWLAWTSLLSTLSLHLHMIMEVAILRKRRYISTILHGITSH